MAEKIKGDIDCDENDIPCVILHKNREKISERAGERRGICMRRRISCR